MSLNDQQEQVRRVISTCQDRWRSNGIPEDKAKTMGAELEEELWYAVENGKTVEEMVGSDVQEFARLWTQGDGPPDSLRDRTVVGVIVVAIFLVFAVGVAIRLFHVIDIVPFLESLRWP